MIIGIIAGFISGFIIMIIAATILLVSVKHSKFSPFACPLMLFGMGVSLFSVLFDISFLRATGNLILFAGLFIGCLGLRYKLKTNAPFLVFISSFFLEQLLSYTLNISFFKLLTAVNNYNFYPFTSLMLPVILMMFVIKKHFRKQRILNSN